MPPAGFEPAIPAGERLQTHALDRSATGIGDLFILTILIRENVCTDTQVFTGNTVHRFPGYCLREYRGSGLVASGVISVTSIGLDYFPGYRF